MALIKCAASCVLFLSCLAPAAASTTVIGSTTAALCYEGAKFGVSSGGLSSCNEALADTALMARDRQKTLINRGVIYNRTGEIDKALADFEAALALRAPVPEIFLNRGNSYLYKRQLDQAVADYTEALNLGLTEAEAAYYNRGIAYQGLKKPDLAKADFCAALAAAPDFGRARGKLGDDAATCPGP